MTPPTCSGSCARITSGSTVAAFPDGLRGEKIPIEARIVAVADAFDAMTTRRPYRESRPPADALAELRRVAGSQLDPQAVEAFVAVYGLSGRLRAIPFCLSR